MSHRPPSSLQRGRLVSGACLLASLACLLLTSRPAAAAGGVDLKEYLRRPGVRLVAVEFYATWCGPCMKAVPRWKELHEKYRQQGLRLVVVNTQDPEGGCSNPGWSPDDMICDEDGFIARQFGVGSKLPAAFLWSWQGNLLVRNGHVEDVEKAVEKYLGDLPRVAVEKGRGVDDDLVVVLREKLGDSGKIVVVAGEEERKAIAAARKKQMSARFNSKLACEMGREVPPNALLKAVKTTGRTPRLMLSLIDLEGGCQMQAATAIWNDKRPSVTVAEAVDKLLSKLRQSKIQMPRGAKTAGAVANSRFREMEKRPEAEGWNPNAGGTMAVVTFNSTPPGAMVSVDGAPLCQTPCSQAVAKGFHSVQMAALSHLPRKEQTDIKGDVTFDWKLEKDVATIQVKTERDGIPVRLDGKEIGKTPIMNFEVRPGPHVVIAGDSKCDQQHEMQLVLKRGDDRTLEMTPVARPAGLLVTATDKLGNVVRGDVYVDGKRVGRTLEAIKLPVCSKRLEVRHDKHGVETRTLDLAERSTKRISVEFSGKNVMECGHKSPDFPKSTSKSAAYGPYRIGSYVMVGEHRSVGGAKNWATSMKKYVGKRAKITKLQGTDNKGCALIKIDIDKGRWSWRARDMTITSPGPTMEVIEAEEKARLAKRKKSSYTTRSTSSVRYSGAWGLTMSWPTDGFAVGGHISPIGLGAGIVGLRADAEVVYSIDGGDWRQLYTGIFDLSLADFLSLMLRGGYGNLSGAGFEPLLGSGVSFGRMGGPGGIEAWFLYDFENASSVSSLNLSWVW